VWQDVVDGSDGEHDKAEGCACGVKSVGAVDDEPHAPVQSFVSGVVDAQADGGEDAGSLRWSAMGICLPTRSRTPPVVDQQVSALSVIPGCCAIAGAVVNSWVV
jgi:hypothetical protein